MHALLSQARLFATVGCHPTHAQDFEADDTTPDQHLLHLRQLITSNRDRVAAVGECGLDYAREHFCPRSTQLTHFRRQLELAIDVRLPLFLHSRDTQGAFVQVMREYATRMREAGVTGVVHSYDGSAEEMRVLCGELGLYIGVNGCSMRTEESVAVVREIPVDRLLLETDAPWCDMRPTHASFKFVKQSDGKVGDDAPYVVPAMRKKERFVAGEMVKGRNEPCMVGMMCVINCRLIVTS